MKKSEPVIVNNCLVHAAEALRFLADNRAQDGADQRFNRQNLVLLSTQVIETNHRHNMLVNGDGKVKCTAVAQTSTGWPNRCEMSAFYALRHLAYYDLKAVSCSTFNKQSVLSIASDLEDMAKQLENLTF